MLLSLAGIPLTAGFVGKFYILAAGVNTQLWLLVVMLVLNSVIGLYYYIKVIAVMFQQPEAAEVGTEPRRKLRPSIYLASVGTLAVLTLLLIGIGVYPSLLVNLIDSLLDTFRTLAAR
jgi:NADH-quinone oxidoreductase subunit N